MEWTKVGDEIFIFQSGACNYFCFNLCKTIRYKSGKVYNE